MHSHICIFIIKQKGVSLSVIDNWGALHKDKNGQWINDVARDKYDNMKKMKDEMREKLFQEEHEGTLSDSIHVPLDDEFGIMVFPRMDTSGCISSMASSSELTDMRSQIKLLSDGFLKLQQENEQLRAFIAASQEKTNNSIESDGDISAGENTYLELQEHDLEEE
ncbi:unnamed protein product [Malus baccata var. baccata]